jgi:hypothetical protein
MDAERSQGEAQRGKEKGGGFESRPKTYRGRQTLSIFSAGNLGWRQLNQQGFSQPFMVRAGEWTWEAVERLRMDVSRRAAGDFER